MADWLTRYYGRTSPASQAAATAMIYRIMAQFVLHMVPGVHLRCLVFWVLSQNLPLPGDVTRLVLSF